MSKGTHSSDSKNSDHNRKRSRGKREGGSSRSYSRSKSPKLRNKDSGERARVERDAKRSEKRDAPREDRGDERALQRDKAAVKQERGQPEDDREKLKSDRNRERDRSEKKSKYRQERNRSRESRDRHSDRYRDKHRTSKYDKKDQYKERTKHRERESDKNRDQMRRASRSRDGERSKGRESKRYGRYRYETSSSPSLSRKYGSRSVSLGHADGRRTPPEPKGGPAPPSPPKPATDLPEPPTPSETAQTLGKILTTVMGEKDGDFGPRIITPKSDATESGMSQMSLGEKTDEVGWKGFPLPKLYKDLKRYFDPVPKFGGNFPPNLYFPIDGFKLRRYKNYRLANDPSASYNDCEYFKTEFKDLLMTDYQSIKRKMEMTEYELEIASMSYG